MHTLIFFRLKFSCFLIALVRTLHRRLTSKWEQQKKNKPGKENVKYHRKIAVFLYLQ